MTTIRKLLFPKEDYILIKDTHRGLWYEDGVLVKQLDAGRYVIPREYDWAGRRQKRVEVVLVDTRERDLTIKGQEILTSDKVAIRVSIIVQFQVTDARAAKHQVENYEDRLYSDVQLAARRSLASMILEDILTNRNRLNEDILRDLKEAAAGYGVSILRADVKDIIFPGNLQDIINRVLAAERTSEAQLVEARTRAEQQRIEAQARSEIQAMETETQSRARQSQAAADAEIQRIKTEAEIRALQEREQAANAYTEHPELMRILELQTLTELSRSANARIYVSFDRPQKSPAEDEK